MKTNDELAKIYAWRLQKDKKSGDIWFQCIHKPTREVKQILAHKATPDALLMRLISEFESHFEAVQISETIVKNGESHGNN